MPVNPLILLLPFSVEVWAIGSMIVLALTIAVTVKLERRRP